MNRHQIVTIRVPCPTCGEWAQLRTDRSPAGPLVLGFSCRNQTDRSHTSPSPGQLHALLPAC